MAISLLIADHHKIFHERGYTNTQIGAQLGISARTVETHRAHLMVRLGLTSPLALTRCAQEQP